MPRIAIISDIHSNLEALSSVLNDINRDGPCTIVHLGDLVGYNANPQECLRILRDRKVISILGNHDLAAFEPAMAESFNVLAHEALRYSRDHLSPGDMTYLASLPRTEMLNGSCLLCHGTPENIQTYIGNVFQAKRTFNLLRKRYAGIHACFYGHTHLQKVWVRDQRGKVMGLKPLPTMLELDPDKMYLINPGSVGQPRQQDNRAHYLTFDFTEHRVHFKAVAYNIAKTQEKILRAKLPEYLALRLQDGV